MQRFVKSVNGVTPGCFVRLAMVLGLSLLCASSGLAAEPTEPATGVAPDEMASAEWLVLGPFAWDRKGPSPQTTDFLKDDGGEAKIDPQIGDSAGGLVWRSAKAIDGRLDFNKIFGYREYHAAYASCRIEADVPSRRFLKIRHDDSATVWLNGEKLGTWGLGTRSIPVDLKTGTNVLLVKVDNGASGWDLFVDLGSPVTFSSPVITPNGDGVNDETMIRLALNQAGRATIKIVDADGDVVKMLTSGAEVAPDATHATWDGQNADGAVMPEGVYDVQATLANGTRLDGQIEVRQSEAMTRSDFAKAKAFFPLGVFYISARVTGPEMFATHCKDIREHGFNTIAFTHSPGFDTNHFLRGDENFLLKTMQAHDLRAIAGVSEAHGFLDDATSHTQANAVASARQLKQAADAYGETVLAYYIGDEPKVDDAHKLSVLSRALEHVDDQRPPLACLIGLNRIKQVYAQLDGPIMYIDPYAVSHGTQPGDFRMKGFGLPEMDFTDYLDYARKTARPDAKLWTIIQTHNFQTQLREPTPAEVRAMSWMAVAHGSTGLIYFIYQTEQGWRGLVHDGQATQRYKVASNVAKRIAPLAATLTQLRYSEESAARSLPEKTDVGTLVHPTTGEVYVVVVNRDVTASREVSIPLRRTPGEVKDIARQAQPAVQDSTVTLSLEPGEGTVLKLGISRDVASD